MNPAMKVVYVQPVRKRLGKAPPVDSFNGEQPEVRFEDWLPTLERAAAWNGWSNEELLLQLAGHLRGKALQEWNLMGQAEKARYKDATVELTRRLDPGSRIMAVQDSGMQSKERLSLWQTTSDV